MTRYRKICVLLSVLVPLTHCFVNAEQPKDPKLISTFQVVRFPNDACQGSNARNGTCYTSQECSSKSGTSAGSCADGFGVCCTFVINTCGSTSSENITVWTQPSTVNVGNCGLNICPMSDDICSLRLDFTSFTITGPNTVTYPTVRRRVGQPAPDLVNAIAADGNSGSAWTSNCLVDTFYATSPSPSTTPPAICGVNSGQHMYVEADVDACNMFRFSIGEAVATGTGAGTQKTITRGVTAAATREWDITISQIECSSLVVPPPGCTKYFFGSTGVAVLQNYNFQSTVDTGAAMHLAMQHERMCVRRERGNCIGCFASAIADFGVSWVAGGAVNIVTTGGCCGYFGAEFLGELGAEVNQFGHGEAAPFGWDCVIIPGAFIPVGDQNGTPIAAQTTAIIQQAMNISPTAGVNPTPSGPQICGNGQSLGPGKETLNLMVIADLQSDATLTQNAPNTICTRNVPFVLEFMSDDLEGLVMSAEDESENEATQEANQGFNINFAQLAC